MGKGSVEFQGVGSVFLIYINHIGGGIVQGRRQVESRGRVLCQRVGDGFDSHCGSFLSVHCQTGKVPGHPCLQILQHLLRLGVREGGQALFLDGGQHAGRMFCNQPPQGVKLGEQLVFQQVIEFLGRAVAAGLRNQ